MLQETQFAFTSSITLSHYSTESTTVYSVCTPYSTHSRPPFPRQLLPSHADTAHHLKIAAPPTGLVAQGHTPVVACRCLPAKQQKQAKIQPGPEA